MGLDGVELIMAVEEEFQVALTEEETYKVETPNDLTELIYSKVRQTEQEACPSQRGFYIVRKALMQNLGMERNEIKPSTRLEEIIRKRSRRRILNNILFSISGGQTVFLRLKRPVWLKIRRS